MRRLSTIVSPLALAAVLLVPGAALAAPVAGPTATVDACTTGGAAGRSVTFRGAMPAIPAGTGRMQMRFELATRPTGGRVWSRIRGVDSFDRWDASDAGVGGFIVRKRVAGLDAGRAYRAVVRYRWLDDAGHIVRAARRVSRACVQPSPAALADLRLSKPKIVGGPRADLVVYRVWAENVGRVATGTFQVTLGVNGTTQPPQTVGSIAPGRRALVTFQAMRCQAGSLVIFTADAAGTVAEGNETNNVLTRRCGASAPPG